MRDIEKADISPTELRSVLATIFQVGAEKIEDYLIIVKRPCEDCDRQYCGDGPIGTTSSRSLVLADDTIATQGSFELHLINRVIAKLAEEWDDERAAR